MHAIVRQHEQELNFRKANDMQAREAVDKMIVDFLGKALLLLSCPCCSIFASLHSPV